MRSFNVKVDGRSFYVEVEEVSPNNIITQNIQPIAIAQPIVGATQPAVVVQEPKEVKHVEKVAAASNGGTEVKSPMPGIILDLKVAEGSTVKKGQSILILEAMKMENDIVALCDGIVSFAVNKSDNVNTGAILAYIK